MQALRTKDIILNNKTVIAETLPIYQDRNDLYFIGNHLQINDPSSQEQL